MAILPINFGSPLSLSFLIKGSINFLSIGSTRIIIPQKAITTKDGKTAVWTVDAEGKAQLKDITLGTETVKIAEVEKGVKEGDKIVAEGFEELEEGETIKN